MKKVSIYCSCLTIIITAIAFTGRAGIAGDTVYTIGVVPQFDARRLQAIWRPILDELEQRTGKRFQLRGSPTIPEFERELMNGAFDFAYMNPFHAALASRDQGYVPMVRDVGRTLQGVLVVREDSPVQEISDLDGKIIAFPAPNALGASLQMRTELHNIHGIRIQPLYVKTHDSVYLNVFLGQTPAGGGVQKTLKRQRPEIREALRILYETRGVAPHPIMVHSRIPKAMRRKVTEALLALGNKPDGKALLQKIPIKQVGPASISDYTPLFDMGLEAFYVKPSS